MEDLESLSSAVDNQNTKKSTNNWIRVYKQWAKERNVCQNLEQLGCETLDETLSSMVKFEKKMEKITSLTVYA